MLKGLQASAIAATIDREFRIEGETHGQESSVRGCQLSEVGYAPPPSSRKVKVPGDS
jgi:hypothetical protein